MRGLSTAVLLFVSLVCISQVFAGEEEESRVKGEDKVIPDGVDRYRVVEPMFEGIRVILAYRGESDAFSVCAPCGGEISSSVSRDITWLPLVFCTQTSHHSCTKRIPAAYRFSGESSSSAQTPLPRIG